MTRGDWFKCVVAVVGCEVVGIAGALFTTPEIPAWYATLVKPALNPPAWVFGPVWTTLYALMGVAAFLVWRHGLRQWRVRRALALFLLQLVLNAAWTAAFFRFHNPGLALVDIAVLWLAIVLTIAAFSRTSRAAAWLMAPYLAWVSFAAYLNAALWFLNR